MNLINRVNLMGGGKSSLNHAFATIQGGDFV